jgi:hypothetical protein
MTFILNEYDVEDAQVKAAHDFHRPNLKRAVLTLARLVEWTNENSDGWAHWAKPANASTSLQNLIHGYYFTYPERNRPDADVSASDLMMVYRPIKAFLTRQGVDHKVVFVND